MDKENGIVVFNPMTQNFVPFLLNENTGEIIINSTNAKDTDDICIVTTWKNVHNLYKKKGNR